MAAITGRHIALEDVSVVIIDGSDVAAIFKNMSLDTSQEEVDVTAAMDTWKKREGGTKDWQMRVTSLVQSTPKFLDMIVSGGVIVVSISSTGFNFIGSGLITGANLSIDNPFTEEATIISAGEAPTIT